MFNLLICSERNGVTTCHLPTKLLLIFNINYY